MTREAPDPSAAHRVRLEELRRRLQTRDRRSFGLPGFRAAAVLVPLVVRTGELHLVFTERSAELRSHSGQVSFPGGKRDEGDADLAETALRETHEELGVEPATVDVLGLLDDTGTPSGYRITPVVGLVEPAPAAYRPNAEVARVFEVSLARLAAPGVLDDHGLFRRLGLVFHNYSFRIDDQVIWGATGRMVHQLLGLLGG